MPDVAYGAQSVIEEQVTNGVAVRMALLYLSGRARREHARYRRWGAGLGRLASEGGCVDRSRRVRRPRRVGLDQCAIVRLRDGASPRSRRRLAARGGRDRGERRRAGWSCARASWTCTATWASRATRTGRRSRLARRAAAAGGFTTVCCMADTNPRLDSGAEIAALPGARRRDARGARAAARLRHPRPRGRRSWRSWPTWPRRARSPSRTMRNRCAAAGCCATPWRTARCSAGPSSSTRSIPTWRRGGVVHEGRVATHLGLPGVPARPRRSRWRAPSRWRG